MSKEKNRIDKRARSVSVTSSGKSGGWKVSGRALCARVCDAQGATAAVEQSRQHTPPWQWPKTKTHRKARLDAAAAGGVGAAAQHFFS